VFTLGSFVFCFVFSRNSSLIFSFSCLRAVSPRGRSFVLHTLKLKGAYLLEALEYVQGLSELARLPSDVARQSFAQLMHSWERQDELYVRMTCLLGLLPWFQITEVTKPLRRFSSTPV
jgi:hypothetical protein